MLSQLSYSPAEAEGTRGRLGVKASRLAAASDASGVPAGKWYLAPSAGVAELAYAGPSKGPGLTALWVRVPPPAPGAITSNRLRYCDVQSPDPRRVESGDPGERCESGKT